MMKRKIKKILKKLCDIGKNDPVKKCPIFLTEGCSHVDGVLCDYPKCSMVKNYYERQKY